MKKLSFDDFQEESMVLDELCNVSGGCCSSNTGSNSTSSHFLDVDGGSYDWDF